MATAVAAPSGSVSLRVCSDVCVVVVEGVRVLVGVMLLVREGEPDMDGEPEPVTVAPTDWDAVRVSAADRDCGVLDGGSDARPETLRAAETLPSVGEAEGMKESECVTEEQRTAVGDTASTLAVIQTEKLGERDRTGVTVRVWPADTTLPVTVTDMDAEPEVESVADGDAVLDADA